MLPVAFLLLALIFGTASAQTSISCVNQGYDLSSITGTDLFFNGTGNTAGTGTVYQWAIRPCGTVTTPGFCTGQPGEFCQGQTTVSSTNTSQVLSGAIWAQVQGSNGQYGIAQFLQDGTSCGPFDREGTIEFFCNATATTPFISSIIELTTCHYQAIIQTAAACSGAAAGFTTTPGTAIVSTSTTTCGAGIYDLSSLNNADITPLNQTAGLGGFQWNIRVCGTVSSPSSCNTTANPTVSICQSVGNSLAFYQPASVPVVWQYLAPGVFSQILQDGAGCAGQNRLTNLTFYCNAQATTAYMSSVVESPICHYQLGVQTSAVCGQAFAGLVQPTVSSTGSVAARSSSAAPSVASSSTTPVVVASSTTTPVVVASSTGTVVVNPTSAPVTASTGTIINPPTNANSAASTLPTLASVAVLVVSALALFA